MVEMEPGEQLEVAPGFRTIAHIRTTASFLGRELGRKYRVSSKKDDTIVRITRES